MPARHEAIGDPITAVSRHAHYPVVTQVFTRSSAYVRRMTAEFCAIERLQLTPL